MILDYFSAWFPVLENAGFAYIFIAFAVNALVAFMVSWRYSGRFLISPPAGKSIRNDNHL